MACEVKGQPQDSAEDVGTWWMLEHLTDLQLLSAREPPMNEEKAHLHETTPGPEPTSTQTALVLTTLMSERVKHTDL